MHPRLAVPFARWLNIEFAVWCDEQIDKLIRGKFNQQRARHQAASSFKVMADILKLSRETAGKLTKPHHFINEARLVNWAVAGHFTALDRDGLSPEELNLLAHLEERNTCLIGIGLSYPIRKQAMQAHLTACTQHQEISHENP